MVVLHGMEMHFFTKCLVLVHFSPLSEPSVRDEEAAGPSLSHAAEQGGALSGEEGTPPQPLLSVASAQQTSKRPR